jgi:hypothetical protein
VPKYTAPNIGGAMTRSYAAIYMNFCLLEHLTLEMLYIARNFSGMRKNFTG